MIYNVCYACKYMDLFWISEKIKENNLLLLFVCVVSMKHERQDAPRKVKTNKFVLYFSRFILSLFQKNEDRLHLGIKNGKIHFVLLSVCTIFAIQIRECYGISANDAYF